MRKGRNCKKTRLVQVSDRLLTPNMINSVLHVLANLKIIVRFISERTRLSARKCNQRSVIKGIFTILKELRNNKDELVAGLLPS